MIHYTTAFDNVEPTDKLKKYIQHKVRELEKYIPQKARESAELAVSLRAARAHNSGDKTCRLSLQLPQAVLHTHETTSHTYAALDIAVAELRRQLAEYKAVHSTQRLRKFIAHTIRRK